MGFLKGTRTTVKIVAAVIIIAFAINSTNGMMSAIELANGNDINNREIQEDDFKINWENLSISVGIDINNDQIYDIENIIVRISFEIYALNAWYTVLNKTTIQIDPSIPENGETIKAGESGEIGIEVAKDQFDMTEFLTAVPLGPTWDLKDLIGTALNARLTMTFEVDYAFSQFQLDVVMVMNNDQITEGL